MQTFGLFVKHPVPGRVKTRLAALLGDEAAARLYAAFLSDLIQRFRNFHACRCLGFTPDDPASREYFEKLAGGEYQLWPQPSSDLGRRMFAFFSDHLREPGDQAILIGSDSPNLPERAVRDALEALKRADVALGPAADGGYYLVGMNYPARDIFREIAWSQPTVLRETVERIHTQSLRLGLLPVWYDVDSPVDREVLRGHLAAVTATGQNHNCPATDDVLRSLDSE